MQKPHVCINYADRFHQNCKKVSWMIFFPNFQDYNAQGFCESFFPDLNFLPLVHLIQNLNEGVQGAGRREKGGGRGEKRRRRGGRKGEGERRERGGRREEMEGREKEEGREGLGERRKGGGRREKRGMENGAKGV